MENHIQTGLLTKNKVGAISGEDRLAEKDYLAAIAAFARLTYESVYVINYETMSFDYVSENPLFLCGYSAEEVLRLGYDFYFKNVTQKDLALLNLINEAGFDFFETVPGDEKKEYTITYDFHLVNKHGKPILVNHKLTPLFLTSRKKMWKAMCIVSISHHAFAGNVVISKQNSDARWQLDTETKRWHKSEKPQLTEREVEILRLYAQGLTIEQIAKQISVTPDTVKYYRRRIFDVLDVSSIVKALSYATDSKMI